MTYSFIATREAELFGGAKPELHLVNPISADLDAMRPSLLPGLIAATRRNADRGFSDAALFEVGPLYRDDTPSGQALVAAGLRSGLTAPKQWRMPARQPDLYDVKADALAALGAMGAPAENVQVSADPPSWYHPGRAGTLRLGPKVLGAFGELHPAVLEALDARPPIAGFEVLLDAVRNRTRRAQSRRFGSRSSSRSSAILPLSSTGSFRPTGCCAPPAESTANSSLTSAFSMSMKGRVCPKGKDRSPSLSYCSRKNAP